MIVRIIGAGAMGLGIANVFAAAGHKVQLTDQTTDLVVTAKQKLDKQLGRLVEKGRLDDQAKTVILDNIMVRSDEDDVSDVDLLLEAVSESTQLKKTIFKAYDGRCKAACLFATNTSSLSITELASGLSHAGRFIGMHFFNPPAVMKLVEVISGLETTEKTIDQTVALCEQLGKTPVVCREAPGFIVNRLLIPMLNEACDLLEQEVATKQAIDKAMQLGANHPMGPLALADLIGLDVCLHIMEILYKETGDSKYRASILLRRLVRAGRLGRKSKQGFYEYN